MKKSGLILTFLALGIILASNQVMAEESVSPSASPTPKTTVRERMVERKENRLEAVTERKEEREENREERQENRQENRANVAALHAERLQRRFAMYSERFGNLVERIEARIAVMKENGKNTAAAEKKIADAKLLLTEAQQLGQSAVDMFDAIEPAKFAEQRDEAFAARDKAMAAREKFKLAFAALREAVVLLKGVK